MFDSAAAGLVAPRTLLNWQLTAHQTWSDVRSFHRRGRAGRRGPRGGDGDSAQEGHSRGGFPRNRHNNLGDSGLGHLGLGQDVSNPTGGGRQERFRCYFKFWISAWARACSEAEGGVPLWRTRGRAHGRDPPLKFEDVTAEPRHVARPSLGGTHGRFGREVLGEVSSAAYPRVIFESPGVRGRCL